MFLHAVAVAIAEIVVVAAVDAVAAAVVVVVEVVDVVVAAVVAVAAAVVAAAVAVVVAKLLLSAPYFGQQLFLAEDSEQQPRKDKKWLKKLSYTPPRFFLDYSPKRCSFKAFSPVFNVIFLLFSFPFIFFP